MSQSDLLDRFAPAALRRSIPVGRPMSPFRVTILGLLTAGWFPCKALQTRLHNVNIMQERQLDLATDMLARWAPANDIATLRQSYHDSDRPGWAGGLSKSFLAASFALGIVNLGQQHWSHAAFLKFFLHPPTPDQPLAMVSVIFLVAAYLLLFIRVNQGVVTLQRFALAFNAMQLPNTAPLELPAFDWGIRPIFLIIGCVFAWFGLFWGLPMMFAWAAFLTYLHDRSYAFRVAVADRLQGLSGVMPVIDTADLCPNTKCRASLPLDATFCPRCGTELSENR